MSGDLKLGIERDRKHETSTLLRTGMLVTFPVLRTCKAMASR